jgi:hypothetical protein
VPGLAELVADEAAERGMRTEAAQILGGLADPRGKPALVRAMRSSDPIVGAEAAIALGRLYDERARPALHRLVYSEDPRLRTDAAISLARLRDRAAVPGLIDAIWLAANRHDREEAIRWLGRLRDPRAVEPLLGTLADSRLRYLSVIALGQIGDARAYEPLVDMLRWASHASVRDNIARALGQLGDARGTAELVRLATTEPDIGSAGESLVRLAAVAAGAIGGSDVGPDSHGLSGFGRCVAGPHDHDWNYLQRTHCTTTGRSASIRLPVPETVRQSPHGVLLLLRLRRSDAGFAVPVRLALGGVPLETIEVDGQWREHRIEVPPARLGSDAVRLTVESDAEAARIAVDHALLLPIAPAIQTASL